jgi:hypothetical protein
MSSLDPALTEWRRAYEFRVRHHPYLRPYADFLLTEGARERTGEDYRALMREPADYLEVIAQDAVTECAWAEADAQESTREWVERNQHYIDRLEGEV